LVAALGEPRRLWGAAGWWRLWGSRHRGPDDGDYFFLPFLPFFFFAMRFTPPSISMESVNYPLTDSST
jgi:hypothetical protein